MYGICLDSLTLVSNRDDRKDKELSDKTARSRSRSRCSYISRSLPVRPTGVGLAEGVAVICVGDPNDVVQCVCVCVFCLVQYVMLLLYS